MARSRKKHAVVKDPSNSHMKKIASRKLRRKVKVAVNKENEILPIMDEVINQYDVCDYKFFAKKEDSWYKKFKRK